MARAGQGDSGTEVCVPQFFVSREGVGKQGSFFLQPLFGKLRSGVQSFGVREVSDGPGSAGDQGHF